MFRGYSIEESHEKIKTYAGRIENPGKKLILKSLNEIGKPPIQSIIDIQKSFLVGTERCLPAYRFLDALGVTQATVHSNLLENIKDKLLNDIEGLDQKQLLILLKETYQFMSVRDLKSVPVAIFKKLSHIPDKYLEYLLNKDYLMDFSPSVRRLAWENNPERFSKVLSEMCEPLRSCGRATDLVLMERTVSSVVEIVGESERLFSVLAAHCLRQQLAAPSTDEMSVWGTLLLEVKLRLQRVQQRDQKAAGAKKDKILDFVGLVDRCRRQKRMDTSDLVSLNDILKSMLVAQSSALEKEYLALHPTVSLDSLLPLNTAVKKATSHDNVGKKRKAGGEAADVSEALLQEAVTFLYSLDEEEVFVHPVTDAIAQNYSRIVRRPMSLSVMRRKVAHNAYSSLRDLDEDVQLLVSNCALYNGPESQYTQMANSLHGRWKVRLKKLLAKTSANWSETNVQPVPAISSLHAKSSTSSSPMVPGVRRAVDKMLAVWGSGGSAREKKLSSCLCAALDYLVTLDNMQLFAQPVTDKIAPNYSKIIERPMSFSVLRARIISGECATLADFGSHIKLIVDNCLVFNAGYDPFVNEAEKLGDGWEALRDGIASTLPQLLESTQSLSGAVTPPPRLIAHTVERIRTRLSEAGVEAQSADALKIVMYALLDEASVIDDKGHFAAPVRTEGYAAVVRAPMDLGLMRVKVDRAKYASLDGFEADLRAISSNCLAFNVPDSPICQSALRLQMWCEQAGPIVRAILSGAADNTLGLDRESTPSVSFAPGINELCANAVTEANIGDVHVSDVLTVEGTAANLSDAQVSEVQTMSGVEVSDKQQTADQSSEVGNGPVTVNSTAVPSRPDLLAALLSSKQAVEATRKSGDLELPQVVVEGPLSWVLAMARDHGLQRLLLVLLASRLHSLAVSALSHFSSSALKVESAASVPFLPNEDRVLRAVLQLCQLSFEPADHTLRPVSDQVLRLHLPALLHRLLAESASVKATGFASRGLSGSITLQARDLLRDAWATLDSPPSLEDKAQYFMEALALELIHLDARK